VSASLTLNVFPRVLKPFSAILGISEDESGLLSIKFAARTRCALSNSLPKIIPKVLSV